MRDRTVGDTFFIAFTTRAFATGVPTVLAGTPVVSAYEDASLTQITAGITLGVDHDGVVGLNMLTIVATGANGFETVKDYNLVITTGTVGGVSVVGEIVGQFSLGLSAAAVDLANATDGLGAIKTVVDAIPTTAMRGTDSALLAVSINLTAGAVDNVTLVATTTTNTDMRGTDGVDTATMRGTDSAALATTVGTPSDFGSGTSTIAANLEDMADNGTAAFDRSTDSLQAIRDRGDVAWTTGPNIPKNANFSDFEFLMVLASDHVTSATGLTVTGQRSIDGGAFAGVSGTITEVSNGIYQFDALAADTNGDLITWRFSSGTADDTFFTFQPIP